MRIYAWLLILAWLIPANAHATCIRIRKGDQLMSCCSAPGGPSSCSKARDPDEPGSPPRPWDEWDHARIGRWNTAVAAGGVAGAGRDGGRFGGLEARAGLLWRWQPRGDFVTKVLQGLAMFAVGNEVGIELRVASFGEHDAGRWGSVTTVGVKLASHVSVHRFRVPSLLHGLPEVQLRLADDGSVTPSLGLRVPWAVMLTRHVGLEAQASFFVHAGFGGHLGLLYRR